MAVVIHEEDSALCHLQHAALHGLVRLRALRLPELLLDSLDVKGGGEGVTGGGIILIVVNSGGRYYPYCHDYYCNYCYYCNYYHYNYCYYYNYYHYQYRI